MTVVRVLLVDDQPEFLRAMAAVVEETPGLVVAGAASTGEECLSLVVKLLPDLVLMDVNLPGIDGLETTRRLREGDAAPVVILLSTYDDDAGQHFVTDCGAAAYITKSDLGPDRLEQAWSRAGR